MLTVSQLTRFLNLERHLRELTLNGEANSMAADVLRARMESCIDERDSTVAVAAPVPRPEGED